jgi:hypothetical protein
MFKAALKLMLKAVVLGSFLTISTSVFYSAPAQAYQCKTAYRIGIAHAYTKFRARGKAKKKWSSSTKSIYGLPWSVWNIAKSKSVNCKKKGSKWRCSAYAKPCLYVVP